MEIAGAAAAVDRVALAPLRDIEADRAARLVIHAGVHREAQAAGARAELGLQRREAAQAAVAAVEEEGDLVAAAVVAAEREGRAFEVAPLAGRGGRLGRRRRAPAAAGPQAASAKSERAG